MALGPGTLMVTCSDPLADVEQGSSLEVVDEDGVWVSMKLDCATTFSATIDYVRQAQGDPDPLAAAEKGLENYMQPGDVVEPAGYSDAANPVFRLVLSDEVLGVVDLMDDGAGGWLPSTVSGCSALEEGESGRAGAENPLTLVRASCDPPRASGRRLRPLPSGEFGSRLHRQRPQGC